MIGFGVGSDHQVVRTDDGAAFFQQVADLAILSCGIRVEGEDVDRRQEGDQREPVLFRPGAVPNPVLQFGKCDRRNAKLLWVMLAKLTKDEVRTVVDGINDDIRVEHVGHKRSLS